MKNETILIFGPKTRLARALLSELQTQGSRPILIARHEYEAERLRQDLPNITTVSFATLGQSLPPTSHATLYCCAAGPIHPAQTGLTDPSAALQDLSAILTVIQHFRKSTLTVVWVSSVVALAPPPARALYGGWKRYVEGVLASAIEGCDDGKLIVIYPGRLTNKKTLARPTSLCYTNYATAANVLRRTANTRRAVRRIIGLDARLWLVLKRFIALVSSLFGRG